MQSLYFIRHGESEFNKANQWAGSSDTPLTDNGHQQAKETGKAVKEKGLSFDVIISSPLERAHHTALHIAREIDYPLDKILIHDLLIERSFGELEGRKEVRALPGYLRSEAAIDEYEGVETLDELHERVRKFLDFLQTLDHETVLVVGHGAFARALRRIINGEPSDVRGKSWSNAEVVKLI